MGGGLTQCPGCDAFVNRLAERCPHCTYPIRRGLLGRAGVERFINVTVLVILLMLGIGALAGLW